MSRLSPKAAEAIAAALSTPAATAPEAGGSARPHRRRRTGHLSRGRSDARRDAPARTRPDLESGHGARVERLHRCRTARGERVAGPVVAGTVDDERGGEPQLDVRGGVSDVVGAGDGRGQETVSDVSEPEPDAVARGWVVPPGGSSVEALFVLAGTSLGIGRTERAASPVWLNLDDLVNLDAIGDPVDGLTEVEITMEDRRVIGAGWPAHFCDAVVDSCSVSSGAPTATPGSPAATPHPTPPAAPAVQFRPCWSPTRSEAAPTAGLLTACWPTRAPCRQRRRPRRAHRCRTEPRRSPDPPSSEPAPAPLRRPAPGRRCASCTCPAPSAPDEGRLARARGRRVSRRLPGAVQAAQEVHGAHVAPRRSSWTAPATCTSGSVGTSCAPSRSRTPTRPGSG